MKIDTTFKIFNSFHCNNKLSYSVLLFSFIGLWWGALFILDFNIMKFLCASMFPPFADMATITYSVDAFRAGVDPYIATEFDPYNRVYNYPKLWIYIFDYLNLNGDKTYIIAMLSITLYSILLLKHLNSCNLNKKQTILLSILLLSPVHFLLLERANGDLYIFMACIISFGLLKYNNTLFRYVSLLLILFAFSLKLYPIVLMVPFLLRIEQKKHFIICLLVFLIYLPIYLYFNFDILKLISQNTPQVTYLSYGRRVIFQKFIEDKFLITILSTIFSIACLAVTLLITSTKRNSVFIDNAVHNDYKTSIFIAGSLIYLFTFMLGNNFEYRLIFLFLCLPFCMEHHYIIPRNLKLLITVTILIRFWQYIPFNYLSKFSSNYDFSLIIFVIEQASSWVIFILLIYYTKFILFKTIGIKLKSFEQLKFNRNSI
jgi:hypothetical protein